MTTLESIGVIFDFAFLQEKKASISIAGINMERAIVSILTGIEIMLLQIYV
jgi:NADH:ubiquinone oxidoreductase subunit K